MAAKRGRPRGIELNRTAVEDSLLRAGITKADLAHAGEMSPGHLADCLYRGKGVSASTAHRLASALGCHVETICPTVSGRFVAVRPNDPPAAEVA